MSKLHFTVSIVNDKQMQELNEKHRGLNHPTDVLSFELSESLPDGTKLMGDIVVDEDFAKRQAKELEHSVEEEIAFLVAHGTMHLMGVHHDDDEK